jgi:hypothetical protein
MRDDGTGEIIVAVCGQFVNGCVFDLPLKRACPPPCRNFFTEASYFLAQCGIVLYNTARRSIELHL